MGNGEPTAPLWARGHSCPCPILLPGPTLQGICLSFFPGCALPGAEVCVVEWEPGAGGGAPRWVSMRLGQRLSRTLNVGDLGTPRDSASGLRAFLSSAPRGMEGSSSQLTCPPTTPGPLMSLSSRSLTNVT